MAIRVNGDEYTNPSPSGNVVIGPLDGFTVIEVLDQPILFWRKKEDRKHNPNMPTVSLYNLYTKIAY